MPPLSRYNIESCKTLPAITECDIELFQTESPSIGILLVALTAREHNFQSLVALSLGSGADDLDPTDFARVGDMRAAIRLQIKPDDLHRPYFGDSFRQQIDLCPNQIWNLKGLLAGKNLHPDVALLSNLGIGALLDLRDDRRIELLHL